MPLVYHVVKGLSTYYLNRQKTLQKAIDGLSVLRSEGIINLYARTPTTVTEFDEWLAKFNNWEQCVIDYMKPRFTGAIVGLFTELGAIPSTDFLHVSLNKEIHEKHKHYLRMIYKELWIIERVIQKGSQLVHEPNPTTWEILWDQQSD